jgi:predicted lipoprotein with Yx(FWY)xxD motif
MQALRHSGPFAIIVLLAVLLAACGGTTTKTPVTNTAQQNTNNAMPATNATPVAQATPMANATPAMNNNMDGANMMQGITITPDMGGSMAALINTGKAMINGKAVSVLLKKGFAVYTYKSDTAFKATCTGACAKDWPPVLATQGMMTVTSSVQLPKQLSVHQTANGAQVFYDGQALYTYAEDKQAGSALGHGQDMAWYLVDFTANNTTMGMGMQGITITPDMTGNMTALIHTGTAMINTHQVNVLMTMQGFAMYYYKADTAFKATCTGACAKDWPPVLATQGMMTVSSSVALPKKLSVHQTANGAQVFYDGHALYTYAEDKQAGNATGRGQDMEWYLVGFLL